MQSKSDSPLPPPGAPVDYFYVVSGCSGSGKSTLISALAYRGEAVVTEPGRRVVKEQIELGEDGLPWANTERFIDLCAARASQDFDRHLPKRRRTFFDRSLINCMSYFVLHGLRPPDRLAAAFRAKRYAPLVFMSAPWKSLFQLDPECRHTFEDAVAEYDVLVPLYRRYGDKLVPIP